MDKRPWKEAKSPWTCWNRYAAVALLTVALFSCQGEFALHELLSIGSWLLLQLLSACLFEVEVRSSVQVVILCRVAITTCETGPASRPAAQVVAAGCAVTHQRDSNMGDPGRVMGMTYISCMSVCL
jgi:hypothetical protein